MRHKTYTLLLLIVLLATTACDKIIMIDFSELPATAQSFIENNFKGIPVDLVQKYKEEPAYKASLSDGTYIWFRSNGDWEKIENSEPGLSFTLLQNLIPHNIISYIKYYYPEATVISVSKNSDGYSVTLNTYTTIDFDKNGEADKKVPGNGWTDTEIQ